MFRGSLQLERSPDLGICDHHQLAGWCQILWGGFIGYGCSHRDEDGIRSTTQEPVERAAKVLDPWPGRHPLRRIPERSLTSVGFGSTATIRRAPAILAPWIALRPTPPAPITTTSWPARSWAEWHHGPDPRDHSTRQQTGNLKRRVLLESEPTWLASTTTFFGKCSTGHSLLQGLSTHGPVSGLAGGILRRLAAGRIDLQHNSDNDHRLESR